MNCVKNRCRPHAELDKISSFLETFFSLNTRLKELSNDAVHQKRWTRVEPQISATNNVLKSSQCFVRDYK